jgi:predicted CoA-substrate-specific enzyme activase
MRPADAPLPLRLGIDLGSTTAKAVLLDPAAGGAVLAEAVRPTGLDPAAAARAVRDAVLAGANATDAAPATVATGYGRAAVDFAGRTVTEITCHAVGVRRLCPDARTVLDIGGQDAKAIRLAPDGSVEDFAMNDRCAAGTGSFLEMLARKLDRPLEALAAVWRSGAAPVEISSTCAVFAESEVVGLLGRGVSADAVAMGVHRAVARRIAAMLRQVAAAPPLVFSGGVAQNETLRRELEAILGQPLAPVASPRTTAALGAALLAGAPRP